MVVCKCRKATKLYCFVHKVPVCGECICFPEHQICVIRTYSEWVIDGDYDWPPTCCLCQNVLEDGTDSQTTRLGCLHVIHTNCFVSHIKSYPQNMAAAGYVCPACSTPIWPPKSIKDSGSRFHSKLKESIMQTGLEKNLFGNHAVSIPSSNGPPPPAFASEPLAHISAGGRRNSEGDSSLSSSINTSLELPATDIVEIDGPSSRGNQLPTQPGATTRKTAYTVERQNSEISYYADDEDGNQKKYSRRGPFRHKFLRALLPFWSSAMPTLPVTAPPRNKDTDEAAASRHPPQRSSRTDLRKILLLMAIMACMATMGILYYRLAQRGFGEMNNNNNNNDEQR